MHQAKGTEEILRRTGRTATRLLALMGLGTALGFAQLPTATILGTVKDSTGAVVPDTTVTVRNIGTGMTRTGKSSADGSYRFVALPVGGLRGPGRTRGVPCRSAQQRDVGGEARSSD